ncbi:MAG TPA: glycerophosphodiester phosphodiesterase family protein [Nitrosomonas halophila]|nr:glycerophosphodiester phosphodiesterase family protein [Nitrosomonas halophila]
MHLLYKAWAAAMVAAMLLPLSSATAACDENCRDAPPSAAPAKHRAASSFNVQLGPRPYYLVESMAEGDLKTALQKCAEGPFHQTGFSIGHRGAPLQFPEHTRQSYAAAARMGAGILECDVTFTKDKALVCRHAQCDLHTTTNILATGLASKCSMPPDYDADKPFANVRCCTSDITVTEFKSLRAKMDAGNPDASTLEEYLDSTPSWRTDLYATDAALMTHAESIELFRALGVKMAPELKAPSVPMPFDGFTQQAYAQKIIDEYKAAGICAEDVYLQSFSLEDIRYWISNAPQFGKQAVFLEAMQDEADLEAATARLPSLAAEGIRIVAPPLWGLVTLNASGEIVPSVYARIAKANGLGIITWTLERSGPLKTGGGWYYQSVADAIGSDGDMYVLLDVLARQIGIRGMFSDWPATVTYYANCMNLE